MKVLLARNDLLPSATFGILYLDGVQECNTLEDPVREIPGVPVRQWKIKGDTAIPSGEYDLELVNSPAHGPDTVRLRDVPGYQYIDIHSGTTAKDTLGCILVGDRVFIKETIPRISGGLLRGVLAKLKQKIVPRLRAGERCTIEVRNPAGYGKPK